MMLKFADIDYEDAIVAGPAWAAVKGSQPFDKLPVVTLEDSGTMIGQSAAISRWVAHFAGLLPSDPTAGEYNRPPEPTTNLP